MRILSPVLSLLLTPCLSLNPLWAQANAAGNAQSALQAPLQLHVVDDPGAALANSTAAKGFIVQVSDSSGNPVSNAAVALRLPEEGPTGRFANGLRAWVAYTNSAGIASFPVIHWLETAGFVEIHVTAAKASLHAGLLIQQQVRGGERPAPALAPVVRPAPPVLQPTPPPQPKISLPEPATVSLPHEDIVPPAVSKSGAAAPKPEKPALTPNPPAASPAPDKTVTIVNLKTGAGGSSPNSKKKWFILAAVGTGAGVGALFAIKAHGAGGGASTAAPGLSIGTPTISVGH